MNDHTAHPFVDTNVVPDRNAGIGSLLRDLQNPQGLGQPLLAGAFAFIDVGVSRAAAAIALKTILERDLMMDITCEATELPEAVPYAYVTPTGERAEAIRRHISGMSPATKSKYAITDWHYVIDRAGAVRSVDYSYGLYGNEVWEALFMGRAFMSSGEIVEFSDATLDAMLAPDVPEIEARIDLERRRDRDPSLTAPSWDGYRIAKNPLEAGLAAFGIALQCTDVPQRIEGRQNVLFLGNVLNHYPREEQARALDRIAASMAGGDLIIVQTDGVDRPSIEVLQVQQQGPLKTRERVRWINTRTLEVEKPTGDRGAWQTTSIKPIVEQMTSHLNELLSRRESAFNVSKEQRVLRQQVVGLVCRTFFRAPPVEETIRLAIREVLRRVPSEADPQGAPVRRRDAEDADGGRVGLDHEERMSEAMMSLLGLSNPAAAAPHRVACVEQLVATGYDERQDRCGLGPG